MRVDLDKINKELEYKNPKEIVDSIFTHFEQLLALETSLSIEDQLVTYYLEKSGYPCYFFHFRHGKAPAENLRYASKKKNTF